MQGANINDDHARIDGKTLNRTTEIPNPLGIVITAGAYSAGDVVGGTIVFDVYSSGGGGIISDIYLTDAENIAAAYTLYIFDELPTEIADNGAWPTGIDIDDLKGLIAKIDLGAGLYLAAINSLRWAHIPNVDQKFETESGNLYMYLVPTTGPTFGATDDIQMSMLVQRN